MNSLFDNTKIYFTVSWNYRRHNFIVKTLFIDDSDTITSSGKSYKKAITIFGNKLQQKFEESKDSLVSNTDKNQKEWIDFKEQVLFFSKDKWFRDEYISRVIEKNNFTAFNEINRIEWKWDKSIDLS